MFLIYFESLLDSMLMDFGCQVEMFLGANMTPNPSEMVLGGVMKVLPVFELEGVLRGLGASWRPRADFDRIFIHF